MFASRLADASSAVIKSGAKEITPIKPREHNEKIVHEMAEYLFDIFDANLLKEYQIMESFEAKAVEAFVERDDVNGEYTFEQENMHKEFLKMFELLLDSFLVKKNITINELLEEVKWYIKQDHVEALEIIEVIDQFSNFRKWADHMTQQAKFYKAHARYAAQLKEAAAVLAHVMGGLHFGVDGDAYGMYSADAKEKEGGGDDGAAVAAGMKASAAAGAEQKQQQHKSAAGNDSDDDDC